MTDDGLHFQATITTRAGRTRILDTSSRRAILDWIDEHYREGDTLIIGMEASGPAVPGFLAALRLGLRQLDVYGGTP